MVTRMAMESCRSSARFSSLEKGPCIATICRAGIPARRHCRRLSSIGSTRGKTRSGSPSSWQKAGSSLAPVVRRMGPGSSRHFWAASRISAAIRQPVRGVASRRRTKQGMPAV